MAPDDGTDGTGTATRHHPLARAAGLLLCSAVAAATGFLLLSAAGVLPVEPWGLTAYLLDYAPLWAGLFGLAFLGLAGRLADRRGIRPVAGRLATGASWALAAVLLPLGAFALWLGLTVLGIAAAI